MRQKALMVLALSFCFCAPVFSPAQTYGSCNDCNCGCCDCDGNCLIDSSGGCCGVSPIIIDTGGDGFFLTSANDGVDFDFFGKGPFLDGWGVQGADHFGVTIEVIGMSKKFIERHPFRGIVFVRLQADYWTRGLGPISNEKCLLGVVGCFPVMSVNTQKLRIVDNETGLLSYFAL